MFQDPDVPPCLRFIVLASRILKTFIFRFTSELFALLRGKLRIVFDISFINTLYSFPPFM